MSDFNNQYLLARSEIGRAPPETFSKYESIAGYSVHTSRNLPVCVDHNQSEVLAILGDIIDPQQPAATNAAIATQRKSIGWSTE